MACVLLTRDIGGILVDAVISEEHETAMEIAEHPVETGAKISDHAWRVPHKVALESVIDESRAYASYQALLDLQRKAEPFDLVTGFHVYKNMLVKVLNTVRDRENSRVLSFTADCQEVIIVSTETTAGTGDGGVENRSGTGGGRGEERAKGQPNLKSSASSLDRAQPVANRGMVQARVAAPVTPAQTSILEGLAGQ